MPISVVLEVAIGLSFVYLILSLICTVVNEGIASIFALRAKNLHDGIQSLFSGATLANSKPLVDAIYDHGLVRGLFKDPSRPSAGTEPSLATERKKRFANTLPSYIPSRTFAVALLDLISPATPAGPSTLADLRAALDKLPQSKARQALLSLSATAQNDLAQFNQNVEDWFNDSMDRAAGWYKRKTQKILLVIAVSVTLITNCDSVLIAKNLWNDSSLRESVAGAANEYVKSHVRPSVNAAQTTPATLEQLKHDITTIKGLQTEVPFPFGWDSEPLAGGLPYWLFKLLGWFCTMLALSLGAPFWFDVLNKFMVVRSTIKPREKSPEESSKD